MHTEMFTYMRGRFVVVLPRSVGFFLIANSFYEDVLCEVTIVCAIEHFGAYSNIFVSNILDLVKPNAVQRNHYRPKCLKFDPTLVEVQTTDKKSEGIENVVKNGFAAPIQHAFYSKEFPHNK